MANHNHLTISKLEISSSNHKKGETSDYLSLNGYLNLIQNSLHLLNIKQKESLMRNLKFLKRRISK